jgi:hypothetical protein
MSFVDISTTTPPKTAFKRGDYNAAEAEMGYFAKAAGTSTAIRRGYACAPINTVTPNVYAVTAGKVGGACVISALPYYWRYDYINVTGAADGNGEDITADDSEVSFQGIKDCSSIIVKISGGIQPGDQVMTAASGAFTKYDGSGAQFIKGTYLGLPGGTTDGSYIKQAATDGQLVVIDFDGM